MTAPNMATITASLERSLQNCSLNRHRKTTSAAAAAAAGSDTGIRISSSSDSPENQLSVDATLELNSHISLPYHWEQCLDLKTGEVYYINWRTGMRATEDPRTATEELGYGGESCSEEEEDDDDDDGGGGSCDSEGSSSESSTSYAFSSKNQNYESEIGKVLVVAGCKSCLMYFMLPKQVQDCPKCCGQLLHFDDRSDDNGSS